MKVNIRHAHPDEYAEICDLGTKSYSEEYYEGEESFSSKLKGCREGCFVADLDGIVGYAISFPYVIGKSFPIDSYFVPVDDPNCWYIHDLCVAEDFRNKGIARILAENIIEHSWNVVSLTAVQNSESFWNKMGFRSFFKLNYCGHEAHYMMLIK